MIELTVLSESLQKTLKSLQTDQQTLFQNTIEVDQLYHIKEKVSKVLPSIAPTINNLSEIQFQDIQKEECEHLEKLLLNFPKIMSDTSDKIKSILRKMEKCAITHPLGIMDIYIDRSSQTIVKDTSSLSANFLRPRIKSKTTFNNFRFQKLPTPKLKPLSLMYSLKDAREVFMDYFDSRGEEAQKFFKLIDSITFLKNSLFREEFTNFCMNLITLHGDNAPSKAVTGINNLYTIIMDSFNSLFGREMRNLLDILKTIQEYSGNRDPTNTVMKESNSYTLKRINRDFPKFPKLPGIIPVNRSKNTDPVVQTDLKILGKSHSSADVFEDIKRYRSALSSMSKLKF